MIDKMILNFFKIVLDAFCFCIFIFISSLVASYFCVPKSITDPWRLALNLALLCFFLSVFMMIFSKKYSTAPVQNSRTFTPWTWWTLKNNKENES